VTLFGGASGRRLDAVLLLLLVAGFGSLGFRKLEQPGLYEDEAFAATPAIKLLTGNPETGATQITAFGRAWPVMRSSYFGPVKIYLLAAAFWIFGISVSVLRATTALFGLAGVVLLYGILRRELGRVPAFASAMLLATDVDYVVATRCDWGPVAFSLLAQVAVLGALLAWVRNPPSRLAPALAGLAMGLGLSHKLDFAACAAATTLAVLLLYGNRLREQRRGAFLAAVFLCAGAAPVLLYTVMTRGEPLRTARAMAASHGNQSFPPTASQLLGLPGALRERVGILGALLRGTAIPDWILGAAPDSSAMAGHSRMPEAAALAPLAFLLFSFRAARSRWRVLALFWIGGCAALLLVAVTPMATGAHHVLLTYPFPHAAVGAALGLCGVAVAASDRRALRGLAVLPALAFLVLVGANLRLGAAFLRELERAGASGYWSAEAERALFETLERDYPSSRIQLLDWGFEHALTLRSRDRLDLRAAYWMLADPRSSRSLVELSLAPEDVYVAHSPALTVLPQALRVVQECLTVRATPAHLPFLIN